MTDVASLQHMSRNELVEAARRQGIERPERLTRVELRAELARRWAAPDDQMDTRGLWGVARSMLASVVEAGLKLPDAASKIRGNASIEVPVKNQAPVATVTLAEIYAAQGHRNRALSMLREVLVQEPDHAEAARILRELTSDSSEAEVDSAAREEGSGGIAQPAPRAVAGASEEISSSDPGSEPGALGASAASGPSTEYVPQRFVETVGEDIASAEPPPVDAVKGPEFPAAGGEEREPSPAALGDLLPGQEPALVLDRRGADLLLYVELSVAAARALGIDPQVGRPLVRVVTVRPARGQPERREEQVSLALPERACRRLSGFQSDDAIRAALGWSSASGFVPLAVGRSLQELGEPGAGSLAERAERAMST